MDVGMQIIHSLSCKYPCTDNTILRQTMTNALHMVISCSHNMSVLPDDGPLRAETCRNVYTVRSISSRTDFFKITEPERSIGQPTNYVLSTNIRSHTEFLLFIFDNVRVITCVKSVFDVCHGWRK
jgi:hypothetical protein